jgi:hypothetical protein
MTVLVGEETRVPARGTAVPWVEQSSEWRVQGDGYRPQLADSRHSALDQNAAVETTNAARPAGAAAAARAGLRGAVRPDCAARGFAAGQSPGDDHTPSGEAVKAVKTAPRARPLASPPLPPFSSGLARNSGAAVGLPDPVPAPPSPFFRGRGDFGALCTRHYHRLREGRQRHVGGGGASSGLTECSTGRRVRKAQFARGEQAFRTATSHCCCDSNRPKVKVARLG